MEKTEFVNGNGERLPLSKIIERQIKSVTISFEKTEMIAGFFSFIYKYKVKKITRKTILIRIGEYEGVKLEVNEQDKIKKIPESLTLRFVLLKSNYDHYLSDIYEHREEFMSDSDPTEGNSELIKVYLFLYPKRIGIKNLKSIDWN